MRLDWKLFPADLYRVGSCLGSSHQLPQSEHLPSLHLPSRIRISYCVDSSPTRGASGQRAVVYKSPPLPSSVSACPHKRSQQGGIHKRSEGKRLRRKSSSRCVQAVWSKSQLGRGSVPVRKWRHTRPMASRPRKHWLQHKLEPCA